MRPRARELARRRFLQGVGCGLLLAGTGRGPEEAAAAPAVTGSRERAGLAPGLFASPDDAAAIGRRYLGQQAAAPAGSLETAAVELLQALADDAGAAGPGVAAGQLRRAALARIEADFVAGSIVELDGWILSRTEALLCVAVELAIG